MADSCLKQTTLSTDIVSPSLHIIAFYVRFVDINYDWVPCLLTFKACTEVFKKEPENTKGMNGKHSRKS